MRRSRQAQAEEKVADLTPMLDVVFIMLIFFIVTATFIKETGVEVNRPDTQTAELKKTVSLLVGVGSDSGIWIDKKKVDVRNVSRSWNVFMLKIPKADCYTGRLYLKSRESLASWFSRRIGITQVAIASEEP